MRRLIVLALVALAAIGGASVAFADGGNSHGRGPAFIGAMGGGHGNDNRGYRDDEKTKHSAEGGFRFVQPHLAPTQSKVEFEFSATSTSCTTGWSVAGAYVVHFVVTEGGAGSADYDVSLSQSGTAVTGTGNYPSPGPTYTYRWTAVGAVHGNAINLTASYTALQDALGTVMQMAGTIATDGTMSGTWADNYPATTPSAHRGGTWTSTSGAAAKVYLSGCTAKGSLRYSEIPAGTAFTMDVRYAQFDGKTAWFAGPGVGAAAGDQWLFIKVVDGGEPGKGADQISFEARYPADAMNAVALKLTPAVGPYAITSGNLQVH